MSLQTGMPSPRPGSVEAAALQFLASGLAPRGLPVSIDISVDQSNWIHLRSWLRQCSDLQLPFRVTLAESPAGPSLASLDGDALGCVRGVLLEWLREFPAPEMSAAGTWHRAMLAQLNRWQRDGSDRPPTRERLILPGFDHPLTADEPALERFLGHLVRLYQDPHLRRWLLQLITGPGFNEAATGRRSFRVAALWLAGVFREPQALAALRDVLLTPENAYLVLAADRDGSRGTSLSGWLDGWTQQLGLSSPGRRDRVFETGATGVSAGHHRVDTTVIIPSYNHEAFVVDALRSVLGQTRATFRVLVIDDGSSDQTMARVTELRDERIQLIRNTENVGLGRSLSRALNSVTTEYVALLNSDDLIHPRRLEKCLEVLDTDPDSAVVATALVPIDAQGRLCSAADSSPVFDGTHIHDWLSWYERSRAVEPPADLARALLERNFLISTSNVVARTDFLNQQRSEWEHLEFCVDWQVFLSAALQHRLRYVPEVLLGYRLHGANTVWFDPARRWRYYLEVNQVAAAALEQIAASAGGSAAEQFAAVLRALGDHLSANTNVDGPGLVLGQFSARLGLRAAMLHGDAVSAGLTSLVRAQSERLTALDVSRQLSEPAEFYRLKDESAQARRLRSLLEALESEQAGLHQAHDVPEADHQTLLEAHGRLKGSFDRMSAETAEFRSNRIRSSLLYQNVVRYRLGDFLLNTAKLRAPLLAAHRLWLAWRGGWSS